MTTVLLANRDVQDALHLKSLISWVDQGLHIKAEVWNADEAWKAFESLDPDVIIVDTGLSGGWVDLVKRIRDVNIWAVILLLLDTPDFDAAQIALEYQVNGCLLKSEITSESLTDNLARCKQRMQRGVQVNSILKREFLRKIISENIIFIPDEQVMHCFDYDKHYNFLFFLVQHNVPLAVNAERESGVPVPQILTDEFFRKLPTPPDSFFICSLYISSSVCGVLYKFVHHISQRQQTEFIYQCSSSICRMHMGRTNQPLSVVSVGPFNYIHELHNQLQERIPLLQLAYYGWRGKLITPVHPVSFKRRSFALLDDAVEQFRTALKNKNLSDCRQLLQVLFEHTDRNCIPIDEVNYISMGLIAAFRQELPYEFMEEACEGLKKDRSSDIVLDVKKLQYWFTVLCDSGLKIMEQTHHSPESGKLRQILDYIDMHYAEDLSVGNVAERFFLSSDYFRHYFKKEVGRNFVDYLTRIRVEKSKKLLENEMYKISDIAQRVGFNSSQYYSLVFRKYVSLSPSQYARKFGYDTSVESGFTRSMY